MQWHGIQPVIHLLTLTNVDSVGNVGILENFSGEILWGLFGFPYIPYILLSLFFNEEGVIIYNAPPRISWMHTQPQPLVR